MGYSTLTEQIQGVKQKMRSNKTKTLQVGTGFTHWAMA